LDIFLPQTPKRDFTSLEKLLLKKRNGEPKMGRPRKNPQNALALLLETGDTQHSAKTSSRQKELNESSLEWQRYVASK
jgi:hypothetical protein